ncbi:hypothetical protein [Actinophytocola sediminis]
MYIDPNVPAGGSTRPSSAVGGEVGSTLHDLELAAGTGNLRVDELTGAATIQAITVVQEQVDTLRQLASAQADTRLGGGYAERIDQFNREWTVAGAGSATEVMDRFSEQLGRLREAVQLSMAAYQSADADAAQRFPPR